MLIHLLWHQSSNCVTFNILSFSNNWNKNCVYKICTLNIWCGLIKHPAKFPWKHCAPIPWDKPHTVPHKSRSNFRHCVWSILWNIADAQPGLKEDQPRHLATHCCGNLGAHVSVDSSEFSCRYPSASRPVTASEIFIMHSHQSSASEMEDTALRILFYFLFPEIIFSAEILNVHFTDLIL
jgi:hypothetical protein